MRGNQSVRQGRIIRSMKASPKGLIVAEIARRDGAQGLPADEKPFKNLLQKLEWAFFVLEPEPIAWLVLFKGRGLIAEGNKVKDLNHVP